MSNILYFIPLQIKRYILLAWHYYSSIGEETNTLLSHMTAEFGRRYKHGTLIYEEFTSWMCYFKFITFIVFGNRKSLELTW
jgi:hypothetical protein